MIISSDQKIGKQKGLRLIARFAHAISRSPCLGSESVQHVFWLPDQPNRCTFPAECAPSVVGFPTLQYLSPVTAAGPPRICTVFRFIEPKGAPILVETAALGQDADGF